MRASSPLAVTTLLSLLCAGAPAASRPAARRRRLPAGTEFNATLRTSLDTRYTVAGSAVVAVLPRPFRRHHRLLMPAGTQILGRVLRSRPGRRQRPAELQILFYEAVWPNGTTVPLAGGISALFTRAGRAVRDRQNGIRVRSAARPGNSGLAEDGRGDSRDYAQPAGVDSTPANLAADPDAPPGQPPPPPDLMRDSDGVPLRIRRAGFGLNGVSGGSILTGAGRYIRINAHTRIQIRIRESVPLPAPPGP